MTIRANMDFRARIIFLMTMRARIITGPLSGDMNAKYKKDLTTGMVFAKSAGNKDFLIRINFMQWMNAIPLPLLIVMALTLGLAPFMPEPHVVEKLRMLFSGTLSKPVDILDLLMHGTPWVLLGLKLVSMGLAKSN